jgi:hypothetical protein
MQSVSVVTGIAVPLMRDRIDTDLIIPAAYMRRLARNGYDDVLFEPLRSDPEFPLDQPRYTGPARSSSGPTSDAGSAGSTRRGLCRTAEGESGRTGHHRRRRSDTVRGWTDATVSDRATPAAAAARGDGPHRRDADPRRGDCRVRARPRRVDAACPVSSRPQDRQLSRHEFSSVAPFPRLAPAPAAVAPEWHPPAPVSAPLASPR